MGERSFMADQTDTAMPFLKSPSRFAAPLRTSPLKLPCREGAFEVAVESEAPSRQTTPNQEQRTVSPLSIIENEQMALTRCLQEQSEAKKSLASAVSSGDATELAEAIACAKSAGVENNHVAQAQETLKHLKSRQMRESMQKRRCSVACLSLTLPEALTSKPLQQHRSSISRLNSPFPEALQPWSRIEQNPPGSLAPESQAMERQISPEAEALLAGMMEAQTFISQSFEVSQVVKRKHEKHSAAVPSKNSCPSLQHQRRRRSSMSMTSIRLR
jgi:hypothetical protein